MNQSTNRLNNKTILVTGSPGFIGANLVIRLLKEMGAGTVISFDNMNDYYDQALKRYRLNLIEQAETESGAEHIFIQGDLSDPDGLEKLFSEHSVDIVVNLAAQAGVRYSIDHPEDYIQSNIVGFFNILECCRRHKPEHLIFASSSSVYGESCNAPFSEEHKTDSPGSLYAATKKCDELLACSYVRTHGLSVTALRFFSVYGPAGRPDMFYYKAAESFVAGEKVKIFNYGDMERDFTYIDDVVEGILRVICSASERPGQYRLFNIGGSSPINILTFIYTLEKALKEAGVIEESFSAADYIEFREMQKGDVRSTCADPSRFEKEFSYRPKTDIYEGLLSFAKWYKEYKVKR